MITEIEVTARGLPAVLWQSVLDAAPDLAWTGRPDVVVVVVPHPDDETLGAGGLLHRLAGAGSEVIAVFVTDGAAGYPGATEDQVQELVRVRRQEAAAALKVLGVDAGRAHFLDVPDGEVAEVEAELAGRLGPMLAGSRAALCLAPWPRDPHPDHQAVGRAAVTACEAAGVMLWQYPIWMRHSIRPQELGADADRLQVLRLPAAEQELKRAAVDTHASQLVSPFEGFGPVLPEHVLDLFADGYEPFFLPAGRATPDLAAGPDGPTSAMPTEGER